MPYEHKGFLIEVEAKGKKFWRDTFNVKDIKGGEEQYRISFDFQFNESHRPNKGTITLYNLDNADIDRFERDSSIKIKMGWLPEGEHEQLLLSGIVRKVRPIQMEKRRTWGCKVTFVDCPLEYMQRYVSRCWARHTPVTTVFKDLVRDGLGVELAEFRPSITPEYRRGKTYYRTIYSALKQTSSDLQSKFFIYNQRCYLLPPEGVIPSNITWSPNNSNLLKQQPSLANKQQRIDGVLTTRLQPASQLCVDHKNLHDYFRVYKGRHFSKHGKKFISEIWGRKV